LAGLSDAVVQLIRSAKKRGYVTHEQVNSVVRSEEVNSEQIEDRPRHVQRDGRQCGRDRGGPAKRGEEPREEAEEQAESESGELVEVQQKVSAKSEAKEPPEGTNGLCRPRRQGHAVPRPTASRS
jgi:RNA polymerase primary sigma factor